MAKSAKKRAKPGPIASQAELAATVGRSRSQISRWVADDRWPFGGAPWPQSKVPEILRWMAETLRSVGGGGAHPELRREKLEQEIRKLRAQADQAELERDGRLAQLISAADVDAEWASVGAMIRNAFAPLAAQLVGLAISHGLPQEAAPEFQRQIEEAIAGILRVLNATVHQDAPPAWN